MEVVLEDVDGNSSVISQTDVSLAETTAMDGEAGEAAFTEAKMQFEISPLHVRSKGTLRIRALFDGDELRCGSLRIGKVLLKPDGTVEEDLAN